MAREKSRLRCGEDKGKVQRVWQLVVVKTDRKKFGEGVTCFHNKKKTTVSDAKRCRTIKLDGRTMIKGNDKQTMNHRTSKQKYWSCGHLRSSSKAVVGGSALWRCGWYIFWLFVFPHDQYLKLKNNVWVEILTIIKYQKNVLLKTYLLWFLVWLVIFTCMSSGSLEEIPPHVSERF